MLKTKSNALLIVEATPGIITGEKKPVAKFVTHIVELWPGTKCRYVFCNLSWWGKMTEQSYLDEFSKFIDWFKFNHVMPAKIAHPFYHYYDSCVNCKGHLLFIIAGKTKRQFFNGRY
ncbi:MAG: hypothetical protein ABI416_19760 [Ginsengibacter sp.]